MMNAINREFLLNLTEFIKEYGLDNNELIKFGAFNNYILYILKPKPPKSCPIICSLSWSEIKESTICLLEKNFIKFNEDKHSQFSLFYIFENNAWQKLHLIIGSHLMKFILQSCVIIFKSSEIRPCYFVLNSDASNFQFKPKPETKERGIFSLSDNKISTLIASYHQDLIVSKARVADDLSDVQILSCQNLDNHLELSVTSVPNALKFDGQDEERILCRKKGETCEEMCPHVTSSAENYGAGFQQTQNSRKRKNAAVFEDSIAPMKKKSKVNNPQTSIESRGPSPLITDSSEETDCEINYHEKKKALKRNKFPVENDLKKSGKPFDPKTSISLSSVFHSREDSLKWPRSNPLSSKTCDELILEILAEDVGTSPNYSFYQSEQKELLDLKSPLQKFLDKHQSADHLRIFKKLFLSKNSPRRNILSYGESQRIRRRRNKHRLQKTQTAMSPIAGQKFLRKHLRKRNPIPPKKILFFLAKIIKKLLYRILCCSKNNYKKFIGQISKFIKFGKEQPFSIKNFVDKIALKHIEWLKNIRKLSLKKNLFAKIVTWFFRNYFLCLLRTCFYISATKNSKSGIICYSKADWISMKKVYFGYLLRTKKLKIINYKTARRFIESIGLCNAGFVRFIPKLYGMRPLIISSYNKSTKEKVSILKTLLHQLHQATTDSPFCNQVFFLDRLKAFETKWKNNGKKNLYFVKVDILDAFGSISQEKLMNIIYGAVGALKLPNDLITLLQIESFGYNYLYKKFIKKEYSIFESLPLTLPKNSINFLKDGKTKFKASELLKFLRRIIFQQVVKEKSSFYHLQFGIPQGGTLSPILSNLYYDDLVKQNLSFIQKDQNFFFRIADDFIFITENLSDAERFYEKMVEGFPDYNCSINKKKIESNLKKSHKSSSECTFYGFVINLINLEVKVDYSVYNKSNIFSSIAFKKNSSKCSEILENHFKQLKMCASSFQVLSQTYAFDDKEVLAFNYFEAAFFVASKYKALVTVLFDHLKNSKYLSQVIFNIGALFIRHNFYLKEINGKLSNELVLCITYKTFSLRLLNDRKWEIVLILIDHVFSTIFRKLSIDEKNCFYQVLNRNSKIRSNFE